MIRAGADAVELDDVSVAYGDVLAVDRVSARFPRGSAIALIGPNGGGKTSLLKAIAGLVVPTGGHVRLPGPPGRSVAYLPQRAEIERRFPLSTADLVLTGLWRRTGAFRAAGAIELAQVDDALGTVGLDGLGRRPIGALSGGQFQRALFARLLVQDAPILLLDEPFAAVDTETADALLCFLPRWQREGRTVIAALHDAEQVRRHFPQALRLDRQVIAAGPTAAVLPLVPLSA